MSSPTNNAMISTMMKTNITFTHRSFAQVRIAFENINHHVQSKSIFPFLGILKGGKDTCGGGLSVNIIIASPILILIVFSRFWWSTSKNHWQRMHFQYHWCDFVWFNVLWQQKLTRSLYSSYILSWLDWRQSLVIRLSWHFRKISD